MGMEMAPDHPRWRFSFLGGGWKEDIFHLGKKNYKKLLIKSNAWGSTQMIIVPLIYGR